MDDTISRQAAIDALDSYILDEVTDAHGDTVRTILERLPFAQPDIIRCKDCKHYLSPHGCGHIDGMVTADENGFCSYAERREE